MILFRIYLLVLLVSGLYSENCYSQDTFTGKIISTRYYVFEDYDAVKKSVRVSPEDTVSKINYVCADTLISIITRNDNDKIVKTVDIGRYRYIYDQERSYYLKIHIPVGKIGSIPIRKWKKVKKEDTGYALTAPHPRVKDRVLKLNYDPTYQYAEQANLGNAFSELFFHLGGLTSVTEVNTTYKYENTVRNEFKVQEVNCKEHIGNFVVKDVSEDKWVEAYFQGADSALVAPVERSTFNDDFSDFVPFDNKSSDYEKAFKDKVVYLDFWASWCEPCRKETPYLQEIKEKYSEDELSIVSISLDKLEGMDKWTEAINSLNMPWFNYLLKGGFEHYLIKQLEIQAIPWYMLIDKNGKIAAPHAPRPSDPRIEGLLDKLINEN